MSEWAPRWLWFRDDLVADGIPDGFLDFLGVFAARKGLVVREETVAAAPAVSAYRSAAVATRLLVLEVPTALARAHPRWRSLRVWQEGSTLHLYGTMPRAAMTVLMATLLPLWFLARSARNSPWEIYLLALIPTVGVVLSVVSLRDANLQAKAAVTGLLAEALREQRALQPTPSVTPPAATAPAPTAAPSEPRIHVADPALAATVRATHIDHEDREREDPEDLVAELERRGGGGT